VVSSSQSTVGILTQTSALSLVVSQLTISNANSVVPASSDVKRKSAPPSKELSKAVDGKFTSVRSTGKLVRLVVPLTLVLSIVRLHLYDQPVGNAILISSLSQVSLCLLFPL
jgi:hypothetical protein